MRTFFVACAIGGFLGLGVYDALHGGYRVGVASLCLAAANLLLLR